jgi:hypothetical protein
MAALLTRAAILSCHTKRATFVQLSVAYAPPHPLPPPDPRRWLIFSTSKTVVTVAVGFYQPLTACKRILWLQYTETHFSVHTLILHLCKLYQPPSPPQKKYFYPGAYPKAHKYFYVAYPSLGCSVAKYVAGVLYPSLRCRVVKYVAGVAYPSLRCRVAKYVAGVAYPSLRCSVAKYVAGVA